MPEITRDFLYQRLVVEKKKQREVATEIGCEQTTISKYARRYDLPANPRANHVYDTNVNYFGTWTEEMAYVTGFSTADGYIYEPKNSLRFELARKDEVVLRYIRNCVSPDTPIKHRDRYEARTGNECDLSLLSMSGKPLIADLAKLHVVPRKTLVKCVPDMEEQYRRHYLRGVFDGDGHCYYRTNGSSNCYIVTFGVAAATQEFLQQLQSLAGGIGRLYSTPTGWSWIIEKRSSALAFADLLYGDGEFWLERKRSKFLEFRRLAGLPEFPWEQRSPVTPILITADHSWSKVTV